MGATKAGRNTSHARGRETAAFDWSAFCQSIEVDEEGCITTAELARARNITHKAASNIIGGLIDRGLVEYRGKVKRPTRTDGVHNVPIYGPKR